ncbi:MAG: VCBS repeat-containing protein [Bacteroidales bacterium]|nr:VCBS repeat-containing protein [Bacteroidales bacterium]
MWYKNGVSTGVTTQNYSPGILPSSSTFYCAITSGSCGTVATSTTSITVYPPFSASISGGTSPICYNTSPGTFTATASGGTGSFSYAWYMNDVFTNVTTPTYNPGLLTSSAYFYCRVTSGSCGTVATSTTSITVYPNLTASISGGISPICYNTSPGTFTAIASGGIGSYSYLWYKNGVSTGVTTQNYSPGLLPSSSTFYCDITSGSCGTVATSTTSITVYPNLTASISGGSSPICYNTSPGTFTATASGGTGSYSYLWYKNGVSTGVTTQNYSPGILPSSSTFYCAITSGSCGTVATSTTSITVHPPFSASISGGTSPICYNTSPGTFTATANGGTGSFSYAWYKNDVFTNQTSSTYNPGPLTANSTIYCAVTSGSCGTVNTTPTTITVIELPTVTSHPSNSFITPTQDASFSVTATGPNLQYQWQSSLTGFDSWSDLSSLPAVNYNTANLTILGSSSNNTMYYRCKVTSDCQVIYSYSAVLSIAFPNITYLEGSAIPDPLSRQINTSLEVGTLPGEVNVNNIGAATYQIPVFVSPGTAGMQPQISIVYNSLAKDGLLGKGWDIAGLSTIQRVPQDFFHDGQTIGVNLQNTDKFALDSNRLVLTSGTYGADGSVYTTEIATFVRVIVHGSSGNGPGWFEVQTKDGNTLEYGNTASSKVEALGSTTVNQWRLNRIKDQNGNYIEFNYFEIDGESYIESIQYTGNLVESMSPYNIIKFAYASKTDRNISYTAGSKVPNTVILTSIRMETENAALVREYKFRYVLDFYTHLKEIVEYGSDNTYLNSTVIGWGESTTSFSQNNSFNNNSINTYYHGDFNGDGRTDFVVTEKKTSFTSSDKWQLFLANNDGISFAYKNEGYLNSTFKGFFVADVDGSGNSEILWKSIESTSVSFFNYSYNVSTGLVRGDTNYDLVFENADSGINLVPADFDGNGKPDYLVLFPSKSLYLTKVSGVNRFGMSFTNPDELKIIDYDGDGKKEILVVTGSTSNIYQYSVANGSFSSVYTSTSFPTSNHRIFPGDFNGDKKSDILSWASGQGWILRFSTGSGFENSPNSPGLTNTDPNGSTLDYNIYVEDLNGDGKDDIIEAYKNASESQLNTFFSIGNGVFNNENNHYTKSSINQDYFNFGDFNGDGKKDLFYYDYSLITNLVNISFFHADELKQYVSVITNGFNHRTKITYNRLNSNSSFYLKGNNAAFPVYDYCGSYYAVSKVETDNGLGSFSPYHYSWEGAKIHRQGKGLIGFNKMTQVDDPRLFKTVKIFDLNDQYYSYFLSKVISMSESMLHDTISVMAYTNSIAVIGGSSVFPYVEKTVSVNNLEQTTDSTIYNYDTYGNNIYTRKEVFNDGYLGGHEATLSTTKQFQQYGNYGIPNKLISIIDSSTYINETPYVRGKSYTYNTYGNLVSETSDPGKTKAVTKTNSSLNNFGLPEVTTLSAAGLTSRTTTVEYDSKGRFITKVTDGMGFFSTKSFDPGTGSVNTETSIDNLTTSYYYDGFGRLVETVTPQSNHINTTLEWGSTNLYSLTVDATGQPFRKTFYDLLGREVSSETEGPNGNILQATIYNNAGQIATKSWPTLGHLEEDGKTYYQYDVYGRLKRDSIPGAYTDYSINGKSTQSLKWIGGDAFYVKSTRTNSLGNVIQSIDGPSTVNNTYYSNGQVKQMIAEGTTVSFYYDEYGRQTSVVNPNSGTTSFVYNAFGELISQTDAKGQTFNMVYDILGRLTSKSGPDGTTSYAYVPNGNGTGQIQTITGPSPAGITQSITYDTYGRPTQLTENIPGDQSLLSLAYDTWNDNTSVTYPSGLIINNVYTNGYLNEIKKSDGTSIWKLDSINGMGQPVQYSLGSNSELQTNFYYNSFADLTMKAMGQRVQTFAFDSLNGNIIERTHKTPGHSLLRESFSYDNRNWLDSSQVYGKTAIALTYDDSGNILSKTGIGSYVYDGTHVNRLDSIASPGSLMPQSDQLLTFTSENLTSSITQENYELQIKYNPGNQRIKTILKEGGNTIKTKYFSGNYEKEVIGSVERHLHYIYSPFGLIAVITKQSSTETLYYTETDHLGSIIGLVTPEGSYAEQFSYEAWGRRRNPVDWTYDSVPTPTLIDRGFTGHEHLDKFDLINMNGRMYDPVIGRFLSVDPYIQFAGNAQNFNGYGYCLNNPLKYSDPSGMLMKAPDENDAAFDAYFGWMTDVTGSWHMSSSRGGGGGYHYDKWTGTYKDRNGDYVNWNEVYNNYIVPNSVFSIHLSDILSKTIINDPAVLPQTTEDYLKQVKIITTTHFWLRGLI